MFVTAVIVIGSLFFSSSTVAFQYGAKAYSYNRARSYGNEPVRRENRYHLFDGTFGYNYQYGDPHSSVQVSFTSTPAYQRKQGAVYDQSIAVSNHREYFVKPSGYVTATTSKSIPVHIPGTSKGSYADTATAYTNVAQAPVEDFDNAKQYGRGGHEYSTGTYKLPAYPPDKSKAKHLKYENPYNEASFRDLYEYHPDTYRYAHPEKVVPLNVFGLPPKHQFQHPVGNVHSSPPTVVHTNAYLSGPVVDSGVTKGSGHYDDQHKFHRLYNFHPDTYEYVNPAKNGPLNVFGLPPKHQYQSPYGNVDSFRPREVPTNAYLPAPVVDVTLPRPNLSSSFSGHVPTTGDSYRGNHASQSQVYSQQTMLRDGNDNHPGGKYNDKGSGQGIYASSVDLPRQQSQYYSYTNSINNGNAPSNYGSQQQSVSHHHQRPSHSDQQMHEYSGKQHLSYGGQQQQPIYGGQQQPRYGGQQQLRYGGQQQPIYDGQQQPRYGGQQQPIYDGQQQPKYDGQQQPRYDGQQHRAYNNQQAAYYDDQRQSSYSGHQQHTNPQQSSDYATSSRKHIIPEKPYAQYSQGPIRYISSEVTNQNAQAPQSRGYTPANTDQYNGQYQYMCKDQHNVQPSVNSEHQRVLRHNFPCRGTFPTQDYGGRTSYSYNKPAEQYKTVLGGQQQQIANSYADAHESVNGRHVSQSGQFVDSRNYRPVGSDRGNNYRPQQHNGNISPIGVIEKNHYAYIGNQPKPVSHYVAVNEGFQQRVSGGPLVHFRNEQRPPFAKVDTVEMQIKRRLIYQRPPLDHSLIRSPMKEFKRYDRSLDHYFGRDNGRIKYDTISRRDNITNITVETSTAKNTVVNDSVLYELQRSNPDSFLFYNPRPNDQYYLPSVMYPSHYEHDRISHNRRHGYNNRGRKQEGILSFLPKLVKIGLGIGITKELALVTEEPNDSYGRHYGRGYSYREPQKGFELKLGLGPFFEKKVMF